MPTKKTKKSASTKAGKYVKEEMHAMKRGSKKVKSRKQAIAIGLSRARKAGVKVGKKKTSSKTSNRKSAAKKMTVKTKPSSRASARNSSKQRETRHRTESTAPEFQTPLASLDSHVEATREMGLSVASHAPKKSPIDEKTKAQNKNAKNVSHTRSHSSQYRG